MKTIMVRDEIYEMLSKMKRKGESFSDVIYRIIMERKKKSLEFFEKYAGALSESDLLEIVMEGRKSLKVREFDI